MIQEKMRTTESINIFFFILLINWLGMTKETDKINLSQKNKSLIKLIL